MNTRFVSALFSVGVMMLAKRSRKMVEGLGLMLAGGLIGFFGIFMGLLSFFFSLAHLPSFAQAGLVTAVLGIVLACLLVALGRGWVK